jgi:hypothetical protein
MPKADRVHSTPPTNTPPLSPDERFGRNPQAESPTKPMFPEPASPASAPGASSLCPALPIPASSPGAFRALPKEIEPHDPNPTCSSGAGVSMTRRFLMNSIVAIPIVSAMPIAGPALTSITAADRGALDAELVQAAQDIQAVDQAIKNMHGKFGDDADSREDYLALEDERNEHIATLITVRAKSMAGIEAKAVCVRLRTLIEDYDQHQQVAVSLADDLVQLGPQSITQPLLAAADAEIVAAGERFEPLLGKYLPARFEWARLSRAARAEATAKFGDDYSSDGWSKPSAGSSPGTAFLMGAHKRNGSVRASAAMMALHEEMRSFAETIRNADVASIAGLRAKTLVAIWDYQPLCADHEGGFEFDNEESHPSLFYAAVAVTGLSAMVGEG